MPQTPPESTAGLLWVALIVIVPALLTALGILWRRSEALRDAYQKKTDEALEKERSLNEKHTAAIEAQAAAIERHTEVVSDANQAYLAVVEALKAVQASLGALEKRVGGRQR